MTDPTRSDRDRITTPTMEGLGTPNPDGARPSAGLRGPPAGTSARDARMEPSRHDGAVLAGTAPVLAAALVLVTALTFFPALGNGFVNYDDPDYVVQNQAIRSLSGESLREFFSSAPLGVYMPLVQLSYALEFHCFGLDPFVFHLDNLLLHLANVLLVFLLMIQLTEDRWLAFLAALLFGIHPMRVESVAWITERKDVLYSFFYLLSLCAYLAHARNGRGWYYPASLLCFGLSLLSKGSAVTLAGVIFLYDALLSPGERRFSLARLMPFLLLSGFFLVIMARAIGPYSGSLEAPGFRLLVASYSAVYYVAKTLVPANLSLYNPYPAGEIDGLPWPFFLAPFLLMALVWAGIWAARRSPLAGFGAGLYLVTILPFLQWVRVGPAIVSNWWSYIPSIGLALILALGVREAATRLADRAAPLRWGFALALLASLLGLGHQTRERCRLWSDSVTLWTDVLEKNPCAFAYVNRGEGLHEQGRLEEALADLNRAVALNPSSEVAFNALGRIHRDLGNASQAMACFDSALKINPSLKDTHDYIGLLLLSQRRWPEAEAAFSRALALDPRFARSYNNRGTAFREMGRLDRSLEDIDRAIALFPEAAPMHLNRALTLSRAGNPSEAREALQKARQLGLAVPASLGARIETGPDGGN